MNEIQTHNHNGLNSQRVNLPDIFGTVDTITAAPVDIPSGDFYSQFKIYNGKLYFYDFVAKAWKVSGAGGGNASSSYFGRITSTGTITVGPSGWTCLKVGTGQYRITHNLATNNYSVNVISVAGASNYAFPWMYDTGLTSTSFEVHFINVTLGTFADVDFMFTLTAG